MSKKKNYLAQTSSCDPKLHKAKYFFDKQEAIDWVEEQGGGEVKARNARTMEGSGYGLEYVEFNPPIRVWGVVYQSKTQGEN
jgi:hypothetical protein